MDRQEIIESIDILRKNNYKYKNKNEYYNKLYDLFDKLSKTNIEESSNITLIERKKILKSIIQNKNFNIFDSKHIKNIKLLSEKYPIYNLLLNEKNCNPVQNKNYEIKFEPEYNEYDKEEFMLEIKMLMEYCTNFIGEQLKCIVFIIIYNILLTNYAFIEEYNNFKKTCRDKYNEILNNLNNKNILNNIIQKHNLPINFIEKWNKIFL
jgi:hypothetical protein